MKKLILSLLVLFAGFYLVNADRSGKQHEAVDQTNIFNKVALDRLLDSYGQATKRAKADTSVSEMFPTIPQHQYPQVFQTYPLYACDGFDYPVGKPNGYSYYKAQNFGDNKHLGEDWNGEGGGNTDLGDPVYSIANGLVTFSKDVCCGWGKTVRIVHYLPDNPEQPFVESVYAHMHTMDVKAGNLVKRGHRIGTIGNADGRYNAHLHLEMRNFINMSLGPGYADDLFGYLDPSRFIAKNRPIGR